MLNRKRIDILLEREIIEAMGCTEPAAAALAGAKAAELFGMKPERGEAVVSPNMMKNAMGVSIPNTSLHGIKAAVSLGIAIQNFPEGTAIALPMHQYGKSRFVSMMYGQFSGITSRISPLSSMQTRVKKSERWGASTDFVK